MSCRWLPFARWGQLCLWAASAVWAIAGPGPDTWTPSKLATPPRIDADLGDTAWETVQPLATFAQVEPISGASPSERTEVRLGWDEKHLYFAVVVHCADPRLIVATQRRRDAILDDDDHFTLVIDPFLDQRNGYYFAFNPLGAKQDALIRGGVTLNTDWDGIWEVATRRTETGWVAEGSIPLSSISFNPRAPAWGLNLERYSARTGERVRWQGPQRQYEVNNLANTGRLVGLSGLRRAAGIEVRPFTTISYVRDRPRDLETTKLKPGFDVFYKLTESTTAVLTINTDFADAEVDDRQVNLTRFPVTFPEKRAFFLQDAGVFSYSLINNNPLPYYSRRIGLGPRGEIVDLVGGARISGREGPVNFGVLGVRTDPSGPIEGKELGVARVLLNLSDQASFGFISTSGDPRTNGNAWLAGTDLNYTTGRLFGRAATPFDGSLYFQRTGSSGRHGNSKAYGWGLKYDSPTWGVVSYLDYVGPDYYPALGQVRQTGVWTGNVKLDYEFNPPPLKRLVPVFNVSTRHSLIYHNREQISVGPELSAETKRGDILLVKLKQEDERLPESFIVGNGVAVRPGKFSGQRYEATLTLSKSRPLSASLGLAKIPYYGGDQIAGTSTLTWRPSPIFNLDGAFNYTAVRLPYAHFPVRLLKLGGAIQFSRTLVWSVLGQYDNLSRAVGFNTRLRWTYAKGGDVFIVANQGANVIDGRWEFTRTELSTKAGATWRY